MVHLPHDWVYCFDPALKDDLVNKGWEPLFTIRMNGKKVWVFNRTPELVDYVQKGNYTSAQILCLQHVFF